MLFALARVSWGSMWWEYFRAIQNSVESPTIAPMAPITMIGTSSRWPFAAAVEAALSVVSPGKIGITASSAIIRNTRKYV